MSQTWTPLPLNISCLASPPCSSAVFLKCKILGRFAACDHPGKEQFISLQARTGAARGILWLAALSVHCFPKSRLSIYPVPATHTGCRNTVVTRMAQTMPSHCAQSQELDLNLYCSPSDSIHIPPNGWYWWALSMVELLRLTVQASYSPFSYLGRDSGIAGGKNQKPTQPLWSSVRP